MYEAPHRCVFDKYHIQNVWFTGGGQVQRFKAFAEGGMYDDVAFVGCYETDKRMEEPEDAKNITTAGIIESKIGSAIRIKLADVGRDWPVWWTEEEEIFHEESHDESEVGVKQI